jgi:hypothetical protein
LNIIDTWDWRYRVAFDQPLRSRVEESIRKMSHEPSRKIMTSLLSTYTSMLSVSQLVSTCCDEACDRQAAIDAATEKMPLFLPVFLGDIYRSKIESSEKLSAANKDVLLKIIKTASTAPFCNYHCDIFEPIFGSTLDTLLKNAVTEIEPPIVDTGISGHDFLKITKEIIRELHETIPSSLKGVAGYIPDFTIKVVPDFGFAEYWPTSLSGADADELIVYDNPDQLGYQNFRATIAHEVFGHSSFYSFVNELQPPFFDHGAIAFLEGWATWCEWTTSHRDLAKHLKSARCKSLELFHGTNAEKIQGDIRAVTSRLGYSKAVASSSIEYYFQYPGMGLSYVLGALWFEHRFSTIEPIEFFKSIQQKPWGDFFALW